MEDGGEYETDVQDFVEEPYSETEEYNDLFEKRKTCVPRCNRRLDELATPYRRIFLALYKEHGYHLPKDKLRHLKHRLHELYALSPEETAKYLEEIRNEARAAAKRRKLKQQLRKFLMCQQKERMRRRAFALFRKLLKCGIGYAARNPVPPLVSIRHRYLADVILEQLCEIRGVKVPDRGDPDALGIFLISVADWMAIAVERLYFAAQISINSLNNETTSYEEAPSAASSTKRCYCREVDDDNFTQRFRQPAAASTPQTSLNKSFQQPVAASTQRSSIDKSFAQPVATSTQRSSVDKGQAAENPDETSSPTRKSSRPFYSFIEEKPVAQSPKKFNQSKGQPSYNYDHMVSMLQDTRLQSTGKQ